MKNSMIVLILLGLVSAREGLAAQAHKEKCTWFTNHKPYGYCVTKTVGSTNPDILYYMHGAGQNQRAWLKHKTMIWKVWEDRGIDAPTVVTFSFGPIWLMAEKNKAKASGLFEFVADKLMPKVEAKLGGLKGRRLVVGESMGGFNAIQLAMKRPEYFSRIAILCPDITSLQPYSSWKEIKEFMTDTGTGFVHTFWEIVMERIFFAHDGSWNHAAPLIAGQELLGPQTPPLYVSYGMQDQFGFFPGARAFAELAQSKGVNVQYEAVTGRHCSFDSQGVAQFLVSQ